MDSILGTLDAFFETGTEGIVWSVTNNDLEGWNKLNCLKDGDYLTIFDSVDKTTVVWEGVIQYEYERNLTPSPFNPNYKNKQYSTRG